MADAEQQLLDRELKAVREVRHPYILAYMGTAAFGFNKILIAPYQRNGNLLQYLERQRNLDRRPLLIQVSEAVEFLHSQHKMIHGDLKCENVLVADDGRALLADFGLSIFIERTEGSTRTATALRQQMTVQFAAPELLFGDIVLDGLNAHDRPTRKTAQTDVYAFGMLVLQAFTGKPPWPGCPYPTIISKLCTREIHPRPENTDPPLGLSDAWWESCVSCWAYDPSERPSMSEVLGTLDSSAGSARRGTMSAGSDVPSDDDGADADDEGNSPCWSVLNLSDSDEPDSLRVQYRRESEEFRAARAALATV
ncbi:kinase-like protein [Auricularia subglabra TFB-10046 SS5]|nr:kinase-like protein [Auricularia subglabra TFB-10046 SS5]